MIKKYSFLFAVATLFSFTCNAQQPTLEEAFDDPGSRFDLKVGTSLLRFAFGTPNVGASVVVDRTFWLYGELGISPFSFRERAQGVFVEGGNVFGQELRLNAAYYRPWNYFDQSVFYILGLDVQGFRYSSIKDDVLTLATHGIFENSGGSNSYQFERDYDSQFQFKRKYMGFGFLLGAEYIFSERFSMTYLLTMGAMTSSLKYDKDNSYGINWTTSEPSGYLKGGLGFYGNATFGLFYKIK